MAVEAPAAPVAAAPEGVQVHKPYGPTPAKTKVGDKFREEFAKLTAPQETPQVNPPKEDATPPATEPSKEVPKPEVTPEPDATPAAVKPESPLDAVLSKEKKTEPVVEHDVLKEFDEKTANWQRAREVMKTQSERIKALETAPKGDPTLATKVQELEAALADRDTRLKAAGAEYSPEYQGLVQEHQKIVGKISSRMKAFGGDAEGLTDALALPYGKYRVAQIEEALSGLDAGKQARVQALIEDLESHDEKIAEFRKDLPARYEEMTARQQQEFATQQQNAIKQLESEFLKISETLPDSVVTMREVPDDVPGAAEWNKDITDARANALRILKPDGADFNESAAIALKGARYDSLEKRYLALHSDYVSLKKSNAELNGSGPDFRGGTKPTVKIAKKPGQKYHETFDAIKRGEMADV